MYRVHDERLSSIFCCDGWRTRRRHCFKISTGNNDSRQLLAMTTADFKFVLVGDSDIDRWPKKMLPLVHGKPPTNVSGRSGGTLDEIVSLVEEILLRREEEKKAPSSLIIFVVCAGENDIGKGMSLSESEDAYSRLLSTVLDADDDEVSLDRRLIFLGPKIEPWLQDDEESRYQYIRMSRSFQRMSTKHPKAHLVNYVDCLLKFCGNTGTQPGALFGGKAMAQSQFFHSDQLHLSDEGYAILKDTVEDAIIQFLT